MRSLSLNRILFTLWELNFKLQWNFKRLKQTSASSSPCKRKFVSFQKLAMCCSRNWSRHDIIFCSPIRQLYSFGLLKESLESPNVLLYPHIDKYYALDNFINNWYTLFLWFLFLKLLYFCNLIASMVTQHSKKHMCTQTTPIKLFKLDITDASHIVSYYSGNNLIADSLWAVWIVVLTARLARENTYDSKPSFKVCLYTPLIFPLRIVVHVALGSNSTRSIQNFVSIEFIRISVQTLLIQLLQYTYICSV